jgi:hypothetical protein
MSEGLATLTGHEVLSSIITVPAGFWLRQRRWVVGLTRQTTRFSIRSKKLKARSKVRGTSATDSEQIFYPARSAGSADASFMHRGYDHGYKANGR